MKDIKKNKIIKEYTKLENVSMLIQGVLFGILLIMVIISLFHNELFLYVEMLICIIMFVLSYNNYKIYKRLGMTLVYAAFGLLVLGVVIGEFLNG